MGNSSESAEDLAVIFPLWQPNFDSQEVLFSCRFLATSTSAAAGGRVPLSDEVCSQVCPHLRYASQSEIPREVISRQTSPLIAPL